jgi:hypothetical protein
VKLCLRVDDLGLLPDKRPDVALELARRFHEEMRRFPYLAGIVPGWLNHEARLWLRSRPAGMTPAIHGWKHLPSGNGMESEFHDLDYWDCRRLLIQAKQVIGDPVIDFIPPWNALPELLAMACCNQSLKRVWGSPLPELTPPAFTDYGWWIPAWLPGYCATAWRMSEDRPSLLEVLETVQGDQVLPVTLHITWEASFSPTFDGVKCFVDRFGPCLISPDEYMRLCAK